MSAWKTAKYLVNAAGTRRLNILTRDNPVLFTYIQEDFFPPAEEDEGAFPDGLWLETGSVSGGQFASLDDAEGAARSELSWLSGEAEEEF